MRESAIEKKVAEWAKSRGILCYKFVSPQQRGVPDRMFVLPYGTVCFIEFKQPGKKPTPLQCAEIKKLNGHGVRAIWCDNAEIAIAHLGDWLLEDKDNDQIL